MKIVKFKLYDNYIVYLFFIFLAFSYALTFRVGFPLKISEIALGVLVLLFLIRMKFRLFAFSTTPNKILLVLICLAVVSTIVNLFWTYNYPLKEYDTRFGYKADSVLKLFYFIVAYFAFLLTTNSLAVNRSKYIKLYLAGAVAAAIYGWYLFLSSLSGISYFILPGMVPPLQTLPILGKEVVRTGTFLEGNYMGLFLLISGVVAIYQRRTKTAIFLLLSIITTVSTMAFSCLIIFLGLHLFKQYFTKRNLHKFALILVVGAIGLSALSVNPAFRAIVINKLTSSTDKINHESYSKTDRLNSTYAAINMGFANPVFGVGISNYALHFEYFNNDPRFANRDFKLIANNVYAEIFSELGAVALILFIAFLISLFKIASNERSGTLRNGLIVLSIYMFTFPTFTLLHIWFYFGLITSLGLDTNK